MKFGMDIPYGIPYGRFEAFYEILIFSRIMAVFKALGLVIFRDSVVPI